MVQGSIRCSTHYSALVRLPGMLVTMGRPLAMCAGRGPNAARSRACAGRGGALFCSSATRPAGRPRSGAVSTGSGGGFSPITRFSCVFCSRSVPRSRGATSGVGRRHKTPNNPAESSLLPSEHSLQPSPRSLIAPAHSLLALPRSVVRARSTPVVARAMGVAARTTTVAARATSPAARRSTGARQCSALAGVPHTDCGGYAGT